MNIQIKKRKDANAITWVISDTHFGHTNIIEYENRPFKTAKEMDNAIIQKWNSVVRKHDLVYFLGDFAFKKSKEQITELVKKLNGRIFLINGNHDTHPAKWYLDCGFVGCVKHPIVVYDNVILKHKPPEENGYVEGMYYIYGHTHSCYQEMEDKQNCFNVSCERLNYLPIPLEELVEALKHNKKEEFKDKYNILKRGIDNGFAYERALAENNIKKEE